MKVCVSILLALGVLVLSGCASTQKQAVEPSTGSVVENQLSLAENCLELAKTQQPLTESLVVLCQKHVQVSSQAITSLGANVDLVLERRMRSAQSSLSALIYSVVGRKVNQFFQEAKGAFARNEFVATGKSLRKMKLTAANAQFPLTSEHSARIKEYKKWGMSLAEKTAASALQAGDTQRAEQALRGAQGFAKDWGVKYYTPQLNNMITKVLGGQH